MKTILASLLSLVAAGTLFSQAASTGTLYWDAEGGKDAAPNTPPSGGNGSNVGTATQDTAHDTSLWYNPLSPAAKVSFNTSAGKGAALYNNLVFGAYTGSSPSSNYSLILSSSSGFTLIKSLTFSDNYTVNPWNGRTITITGNTTADPGYAGLKIAITDATKTLTLNGTPTNANPSASVFRINSAFSQAALNSPAIQLTGPGTINLSNGFQLNQSNANSRVHIGNAGTALILNINNSVVTANHLQTGGASITLTDINSSVTVASTNAEDALQIGNQTTNASQTTDFGITSSTLTTQLAHSATNLTINNGNLTATATTANGISFGGANDNAIGGTLNLQGGTLTTTNISANPSASFAGTALLNLNGGTLKPAASATQTQLNNFITGFKNTATNKVALGSAGITIDTSAINTSTTDGIATILSDISGNGELRKTGANALRLAGNSTHTGDTYVLGGHLIVTGNITASTVYLDPGSTLTAAGSLAAVSNYGPSTLNLQSGASIDTLSLSGDITINLDLSAVSDPLQSLATLGDLLKASPSAILTLNLTGIVPETEYALFTITGQNDFAPEDILLTGDSTALQLNFQNNILSLGVIPEPSTTALLLSFLTIALLLSRRKK